MKHFSSILLLLCFCMGMTAATPSDDVTLTGTVTDKVDGEPLIGVTLYIPELKSTTITDVNGHYVFDRLPRKTVTLQVSYVGHQTIIEEVNLATTRQRDFTMLESNALINEVVVTGVAGSQLLKDSPTPVAILTLRDLQTTSSTNIIDAIARRPGLADMGSAEVTVTAGV